MSGKTMSTKAAGSKLRQELVRREAELTILNSVQAGLASKLEFQSIVDLIGDKIRDIFDAQEVQLVTFDHEKDLLIRNYVVENGQRYYIDPVPISKIWAMFISRRDTWMVSDVPGLLKEIDPDYQLPAGEMPRSALFVPLMHDGKMVGAINLAFMDMENAFDDSDARLLQALANSMGLALENARLFEEAQNLLKETRQRAAELEVINSVHQELNLRRGAQSIYDLVGDKIRDFLDAQVVMISLYDQETDTIEHRYAIEHGQRVYSPGPNPPGGFRSKIIQTRQPLLVNSDVAEQAARLGQPTLPGTITPKSWLGVPLLVEDHVTGILSVQNVEQENAFRESDVRILQTLAASMSLGLENAHLWEQEALYRQALEREFEIGREIQAGFLPDKLPQPEGWEVAALLQPAREVAGDFYDVFELPEGRLGLVIADVCDKGLGAALFMTLFRSLIRAVSNIDFFARTEPGDANSSAVRLKNAIWLTNNYIAETHGPTGMFATIFFGILDLNTGLLTYINGGHLPPVLIKKGGARQILDVTGPAVGVVLDSDYAIREIMIDHGDFLFASTDGLTDTMDPTGDYFGEKELMPLLTGSQNLSTLLQKIQDRVEIFSAGTKRSDDITLLAIRRNK
jgi:serine phosphatase RsbU (regulator of sigma subunit)